MTESSTGTWSPGWGPPASDLRNEYAAQPGEERLPFLGRATLLVDRGRLTVRPGNALAASELGVGFAATNRRTAELQEEHRQRAMACVVLRAGTGRWRWLDPLGAPWQDPVRAIAAAIWEDVEEAVAQARLLAERRGTEYLVSWSRPSRSLQVESRSFYARNVRRAAAGAAQRATWQDVAFYVVHPDGQVLSVIGERFYNAAPGEGAS